MAVDFQVLAQLLPDMRRRAQAASAYVTVNPLRLVETEDGTLSGIAEACHAKAHPEEEPHTVVDYCCDSWVIDTGSEALAALWLAALTDMPLLLDAIQEVKQASDRGINLLYGPPPVEHGIRISGSLGGFEAYGRCTCSEGYLSEQKDLADLATWITTHLKQHKTTPAAGENRHAPTR